MKETRVELIKRLYNVYKMLLTTFKTTFIITKMGDMHKYVEKDTTK